MNMTELVTLEVPYPEFGIKVFIIGSDDFYTVGFEDCFENTLQLAYENIPQHTVEVLVFNNVVDAANVAQKLMANPNKPVQVPLGHETIKVNAHMYREMMG